MSSSARCCRHAAAGRWPAHTLQGQSSSMDLGNLPSAHDAVCWSMYDLVYVRVSCACIQLHWGRSLPSRDQELRQLPRKHHSMCLIATYPILYAHIRTAECMMPLMRKYMAGYVSSVVYVHTTCRQIFVIHAHGLFAISVCKHKATTPRVGRSSKITGQMTEQNRRL